MLDAFFQQSPEYIAAAGFLMWLLFESFGRISELRWVIAGIIFATVGLFYLLDPLINPEGYIQFEPSELSTTFLQVLIFLVTFRLIFPYVTLETPTSALRAFDPRLLANRRIPHILIVSWLVLFTIGVSRMNFDVIGALFPLQTRANWGHQLWMRPRLGAGIDFAVSAAGYVYEFVCSLFGLVAVGTRNPRIRRLMIVMMIITWPFFFLCGARHKIIAVAIPSILAVLLIKRWSREQQMLFIGGCFVIINVFMLAIIEFRNEGFSKLGEGDSLERLRNAKHLGLSMTEELIYANRYQSDGRLPLQWGYTYYANAVSFIPRPLWPNKPFPGERYAELRVGYYNGELAATMSNGLVGQGVVDFGKWLGPVAPAVLLSLLARWICSLLENGNRFLRACVVLVCLGSLPNLGRDISLMPFWPVIFGIVGVKFYERSAQRQSRKQLPLRSRPFASQH